MSTLMIGDTVEINAERKRPACKNCLNPVCETVKTGRIYSAIPTKKVHNYHTSYLIDYYVIFTGVDKGCYFKASELKKVE